MKTLKLLAIFMLSLVFTSTYAQYNFKNEDLQELSKKVVGVDTNSAKKLIKLDSIYTTNKTMNTSLTNIGLSTGSADTKLNKLDSIIARNTTTNSSLSTIGLSTASTDTKLNKLDSIIVRLTNNNQTTRITDGTYTATVANAAVASTAADRALVIDQRPTTATFGSNTTSLISYTTDANTITTTNCIRVIIRNKSTSTDGTITYGGVGFNIGKYNNTSGYPTTYTFDSLYDPASKKYSPLATLVVNALASNIVVERIFAQ